MKDEKHDEDEKPDFIDKILNTGWGKILLGLVIAGIAYFLYQDFSALESGEKESMRVNRIIAFLYTIGGVWGVVSLLGIVSLGFVAWGIKQCISGKE